MPEALPESPQREALLNVLPEGHRLYTASPLEQEGFK